ARDRRRQQLVPRARRARLRAAPGLVERRGHLRLAPPRGQPGRRDRRQPHRRPRHARAGRRMIDGVVVKELVVHADDRGLLMEVVRDDEPVFRAVKQTTFTITYPGVIKAFHRHRRQWDVWFFAAGSAQVVLHDLRDGSPTRGRTDVLYAGERRPLVVAIPPGVAHGYRVLGSEPATLFYHTTERYDPADEERIPHDDARIGFDWRTQHR